MLPVTICYAEAPLHPNRLKPLQQQCPRPRRQCRSKERTRILEAECRSAVIRRVACASVDFKSFFEGKNVGGGQQDFACLLRSFDFTPTRRTACASGGCFGLRSCLTLPTATRLMVNYPNCSTSGGQRWLLYFSPARRRRRRGGDYQMAEEARPTAPLALE